MDEEFVVGNYWVCLRGLVVVGDFELFIFVIVVWRGVGEVDFVVFVE